MFRRPRGKTPPPDLFSGLLRGYPGADKPAAAHETFPDPEALAKLDYLRMDPRSPQGKIPLGLVGGRMEETVLSGGRIEYAALGGTLLGILDDRHRVIVAGNRSGKGRSLLLPQLILDPDNSYLSFDPKGDHASETALWRAKALGQEVYLVDSHKTAGEACADLRISFNPMQYIDKDDPDAVVQAATDIADALVIPSGRGDSHWDDTARAFIEGVVAHVMTADSFKGKRNLGEVRHQIMAHGDDEEGPLAEAMIQSTAVQGFVAAAAMEFFGKEERERSGTLSTARKHLHFISYPKIEAVLRDGPLNLAELLSRKISVYVCLPATMLGPAAGLLRLFVNLTLSGLEQNTHRHDHQYQRGAHRCHLILDEYAAISRLKSLEVAAGQVAGLGCTLTVVLQDLSQLQAIHRERWETFLGNAGTLSFFGNSDTTTLSWIEKRLGTTEVRSASRRTPSLSQAIGEGDLGASYSVSNHPLLSVPEIARTFERDDPLARQLVFLPTAGPAIIQRCLYDKHEAFAPFRQWRKSNAP